MYVWMCLQTDAHIKSVCLYVYGCGKQFIVYMYLCMYVCMLFVCIPVLIETTHYIQTFVHCMYKYAYKYVCNIMQEHKLNNIFT